jgi:ABC-type multidrug transport system ATPase subunit
VLFLDEPTSGLDSVSAQSVIALLRQEAERGMTILATIHQPSSKIFNGFDRVMVLSGQG